MPTVSDEFLSQVEVFAEAARREAARRTVGTSFVQRTPGVCGGEARVRNTRIPVWLVIVGHKRGASEADLLADYPSLAPADFDAAWSYYRAHTAEIDDDIRGNESGEQLPTAGTAA